MTDEEPDVIGDFRERRERIVTEMGGRARVQALSDQGRPTVRDRITRFCDPGTFREVGTFARSERQEDRDTTPGDGKVGGHARLDGRPVTVAGDDITVKRGSSSAVGERRVERLYEQALNAGNPFVFFGEAGGARIPDVMRVESFTRLTAMPWLATRRRRIPTATAIVGESFGGSSFHSALTDFVVQVRGSVLAIASPRVISVATGESITMEELGGVDVHASTTGQIDQAAETEEEAFTAIRRFLALIPPNAWTAPVRAGSPGVADREPRLAAIVPARRRRAYDMRRLLGVLLDGEPFVELRPSIGRSLITGLGRIDGYAVGVIASQPMHLAGALGPEACDKATRLLCLCDAFDIPVLFLHDTPGFLVGRGVEHAGLLHRASRMQQALALCGAPRLTVIIRKSFGMAFQVLNGTGMGADSIYAWPGAEVGFMDPEVAASVVYGKQLTELTGSARADEHGRLTRQIASNTSVFDAAGVMSVDEIIEPDQTRAVLAARLGELSTRRPRPESARPLAGWPTC
jgi:acetyl-CoA carboxylase carboxyltransferase component